MILKVLKNQLIFLITYLLAIFLIIFYYALTETKDPIYPIVIAAFFLVVYLLIAFGYTKLFYRNLKYLALNTYQVDSFNTEKTDTYSTINKIHNRYNEKITRLNDASIENRRFISACIHNLKTPITVSNLVLQRLEAEEISKEEAIEELKKQNKRTIDSLDMILDTERITEFAYDYTPEAIDLKLEVEKIINENKSSFIYSHIYPVLSGENKLVYTDSKWNKVLINQIISNALKYSKDALDKHIYFDITTENDYVVLKIKDQGIGIQEYDLPKVFEPFFTGDNGRKDFNSSGIGLYLCKLICDKLNHKITIESEPSKGTTVIISYLAKL